MATSSTESQVALIRSATLAFDLLLNNDLPNARSQFLAHPDSAAHGVGLGITAFLQAALGQEDAELATALEALLKAEAQATAAEKAAKGGKGKGVYPAGLEYKASSLLELPAWLQTTEDCADGLFVSLARTPVIALFPSLSPTLDLDARCSPLASSRTHSYRILHVSRLSRVRFGLELTLRLGWPAPFCSEFTKAVWKLNRAYKGFKQVYQVCALALLAAQ